MTLSRHVPAGRTKPLRRVATAVVALLMTLGFSLPVVPQTAEQPNWKREAALRAATLQDNPQQLTSWTGRIDAGDADSVLAELKSSMDTGTPAFEQQLYRLAQSMAEAPLDPGSDRLLDWLQAYEPQVRVAHEESAAYGVPLFAITAAARGSATERQRRVSERQSAGLLADQQRWIARYRAAGPVERQGLERGLATAGRENLRSLGEVLESELAFDPLLARPAGTIASRLEDTGLLLLAIQFSQGADSVHLLREAVWRLDAAKRSELLTAITRQPMEGRHSNVANEPTQAAAIRLATQSSTEKAALGISILAPGLRNDAGVSRQLLQLLDDPQLGAAAALALAGHPDAGVQASLRQKMHERGPAGRRAALALGESPAGILQQQSRGEEE